MRFIVMLIVLAFPILDVLVTLRFARWTGIPALAWFIASAAAGMLLLHHERIGFRARTLAGSMPMNRTPSPHPSPPLGERVPEGRVRGPLAGSGAQSASKCRGVLSPQRSAGRGLGRGEFEKCGCEQ